MIRNSTFLPPPLTRFAIALALFALALGHRAVGAEPPQLRILSYNIHHGSGADGKIDLARLAKVISETRPDLVALQEVDQNTRRCGGVDQTVRLAELTGLHHAFGKAMDFDGGQYGEAILSRIKFEESVVHPLPAAEGHEPRAALAARVAFPGLPQLWFVGTHLDHTRRDTDRLAQTQELLKQYPHDGKIPVIVVGDLNATPDSKVLQQFRQHWRTAAGKSPAATSPASNPRAKIDYVLMRRSDPWQVIEVSVLPESEASDHRPLLVVLEWTGAPL